MTADLRRRPPQMARGARPARRRSPPRVSWGMRGGSTTWLSVRRFDRMHPDRRPPVVAAAWIGDLGLLRGG